MRRSLAMHRSSTPGKRNSLERGRRCEAAAQPAVAVGPARRSLRSLSRPPLNGDIVSQTGRAMSSNQLTEIFVELLEEGIACWRPVRAVPLGGTSFRIAADQEIPTEEKWAFSPGEAVTCEPRMFQNGLKALVATKRLDAG